MIETTNQTCEIGTIHISDREWRRTNRNWADPQYIAYIDDLIQPGGFAIRLWIKQANACVNCYDDLSHEAFVQRDEISRLNHRGYMSESASVSMTGVVHKIISSPLPDVADKAEISVDAAEDLYKEIRIDNTLQDSNGNEVELKAGDSVTVTVETEPQHES